MLTDNRLVMRVKSIRLCHCSTALRIVCLHKVWPCCSTAYWSCFRTYSVLMPSSVVWWCFTSAVVVVVQRGLALNCPVGKYIYFPMLRAYVCKENEWVIPLDCIMAPDVCSSLGILGIFLFSQTCCAFEDNRVCLDPCRWHNSTTALLSVVWLHCFMLWFLVTTADVFALFYMVALLQVSNSLNDTGDTCGYIASGANPVFQLSHTFVGHARSSLWLCTWSKQFLGCFTLSQCLPPTFPGTVLFHAVWLSFQWLSACSGGVSRKQQWSQGMSRLYVSVHTSGGNTPFHSRWKCKLKREFHLRSHPLLPPEGVWLVRLLGGHKKGTCYSSCTSLNKLQEGGQKRESMCGKREEGETG